MIPTIIHQIWIQGYNNIPDKLKLYHNGCQEVNNNFKHMLWDDVKIKKILADNFDEKYVDTYNNYNIPAQKADFARYAILYIYGGVYLDMDMVCRKNLSPFLNYSLFCTTDSIFFLSKRYLNGIIGAKRQHPVFLFVFKNIFDRLPKSFNVTYSTGTKLFYDSVNDYKNTTGIDDLTIVDRKYLHPCNTYDSDDCPETCTECYVAHTNYGSWASGSSKMLDKYIIKNIKILIPIIIIFILFIIWTKKF